VTVTIHHEAKWSWVDYPNRRVDTWRGIARYELYALGQTAPRYPVPALHDACIDVDVNSLAFATAQLPITVHFATEAWQAFHGIGVWGDTSFTD